MPGAVTFAQLPADISSAVRAVKAQLREQIGNPVAALAEDTVWWHSDMIHSVGEVTGQKGWGNVMYIPASPYCEKNAAYAGSCGQAFLRGASPRDFAAEDYETSWTGRAVPEDLNQTGRQQLGLQDWQPA